MASVSPRRTPQDTTKKVSKSATHAGGRGTGRPDKARASTGGSRRGTWILVAAIAAMAAIAVVIAVVATGDDNNTATEPSNLKQVQPVQISGDPLPPFSDSNQGDDAGGAVAPVISGFTFAGHPTVAPTEGRPTMITFVAHWCPHCQKEVPLIASWVSEGGLKGVDLVAVATGTSPKADNYPPSAWLTREHWPGAVIADDANATAAEAYGLSGYPYLVFIDAKGKVRYRLSGEQPTSELDKGIGLIATTGGTQNG